MTPLNTAERRSTFFRFLLFFIISLVIVAITAFYGIQVPFKENEIMRHQIAGYQDDQLFLQRFSVKVAQTREMLEKINKPGVEPLILDGRIQGSIDSLNIQIGPDSTKHPLLYRDVVNSLLILRQAKRDLRENSRNDEEKAQLKLDLATAKNQILQLQMANDNLRKH
jgi:hypothetical protein